MANGVGWNRTESDGSGWGSYAPGAQRGTHDHAVHLGPGGEAHILMMRNLSHENTTACRQHASDKRGMWRVMRPAPLPGAGRIAYPIFRFSMACLLQAMANVSTRLSSSGPGHHHRDDTRGCSGLWGGALCRLRGSPPPRGRTLDWGRKPPEGGNQQKKIVGRKLPDGEVGAQCMFR